MDEDPDLSTIIEMIRTLIEPIPAERQAQAIMSVVDAVSGFLDNTREFLPFTEESDKLNDFITNYAQFLPVGSVRLPPVPKGYVRLFRGQILKPARRARGAESAGRVFTTRKSQAEEFARIANDEAPSGTFFVDVPEDIAAKFRRGSGPVHELPRKLADKMKLLEQLK